MKLAEFVNLKGNLRECLEKIGQRLKFLESDLEQIEKGRIANLGKELVASANQLKKLNFQRHDTIDELFEDETYCTNMGSVKNREMICDYISCLNGMKLEIDYVGNSCLKKADANWYESRSSILNLRFKEALAISSDFDFSKFFNQYQNKFDDLLSKSIQQVIFV